MEGLKFHEQETVYENQSFKNLLANIYKAEADSAKAEVNIIKKVELMLDTIANLMQMINPVEEQYFNSDDTNNSASIKLTIKKERVINEKVIDNLNKMAEDLSKVLRGLSYLIGESLDALGDCKEARGKLIEKLGNIIKTKENVYKSK